MVYYIAKYKGGDSHLLDCVETFDRLRGKKRAELVVEGAHALIDAGLTDGYILNICKYHANNGETWDYISQSWYIYTDGTKWFFKQHHSCKAKHEITL